jgi:HprK-related kinase A
MAGPQAVYDALRGDGVWLDVGAAMIRLRSNCKLLAQQLVAVYPHFPFLDRQDWADLHVDVSHPRGLRRWVRPQVQLFSDGVAPFDPFPADSPLPLFEWGANFIIGARLNQFLLLHAGVVERDGCALVLPAMPGSGKSTLTAALAQRGWRLLSDEFGAYDPRTGLFTAVLKPVALKNQSIGVIRQFAPGATLGPTFPKTRKGDVAHLAASLSDVRRRHEAARPRMVVLPKWQAGHDTQLEPVDEETLFSSLAFNSFNFEMLGGYGFEAAVALYRQCRGWRLTYTHLDEAVAAIDAAWQTLPAQPLRPEQP